MNYSNRDRITDDYDRRAYEQILLVVNREPGVMKRAGGRIGRSIGSFGKRATDKLPPAALDAIEQALRKAMSGFRVLVVEPAFRSVVLKKVKGSYVRAGFEVAGLEDIGDLPLRVIDDVMPALGLRYSATMALEGAGAGAVITGAELLAAFGTVASAGVAAGPSVGAVAGAMAADAALVLGASMRVIAHVGAYFGRDASLPDEQLFALSIINWTSSGTGQAKAVAFAELSRLTQQLIRGVPWLQLYEHSSVVALEKLFVSLGFKLTKDKLGQAIPVAGVLIGAGINAQILHSVARDAVLAYRLRHLVERYGLDPAEFAGLASLPAEHGEGFSSLGLLDDSTGDPSDRASPEVEA